MSTTSRKVLLAPNKLTFQDGAAAGVSSVNTSMSTLTDVGDLDVDHSHQLRHNMNHPVMTSTSRVSSVPIAAGSTRSQSQQQQPQEVNYYKRPLTTPITPNNSSTTPGGGMAAVGSSTASSVGSVLADDAAAVVVSNASASVSLASRS